MPLTKTIQRCCLSGIQLSALAFSFSLLNSSAPAVAESGKAAGTEEKAVDQKTNESEISTLSQGKLLEQILKLIKLCRYQEAIPYSKQLCLRSSKDFGNESEFAATALNNLGFLYQQVGDYAQAEPLFQKALEIREKLLGPQASDVALSLNNLALLYQSEGDYARAESIYQRALNIKEKTYGAGSLEAATEMNNLASLYKERGELEQAEKLFKAALDIFEKKYGPEDSRVATVLNNLAGIYKDKNDFAQAESLYKKVLAIDKKVLAADHLDQARDLNNLALLYFDEGKADEALPLYMQALSIRESALGPEHPELITLLENLALLYASKSEMKQALEFQKRANEICEHALSMILSTGSENQKRLFLERVSNQIDSTLSTHLITAPQNQVAAQLALTTILRRKGRVLDLLSQEISTLRRHLSEEDRSLLDDLSSTRAQLSALILRGPSSDQADKYRENLNALQEKAQKLESTVSLHSAAFSKRQSPVTVELISRALPVDSALIEFQTFRVLDAKAESRKARFGVNHYAAYVLSPDGSLAAFDLGECDKINKQVAEFRSAIKNISSDEFKEKARQLDAVLIEPVRSLLKNTKTVLLSPDGTLNLLPFAALIDKNGKFLIETYAIDYLTSGRDLLPLHTGEASRQEPYIIANPLFGPVKSQTSLANEQNRFSNLAIPFSSFTPLAGTAQEAKTIAALLPGAIVLTGKDANKSIFKSLAGPRILHVATHGYFVPDSVAARLGTPAESTRAIELIEKAGRPITLSNPLLRSGLVLAGANEMNSDPQKDGILTALEVSGLDLWGTKLVVLSACETGLGEIKQGEGVYGLRRALLIAGAESAVVSLWPVSDQATAFLMSDFYKRLISGESRIEALRQSQLHLLQILKHPNYWAAFIPVGQWRKL